MHHVVSTLLGTFIAIGGSYVTKSLFEQEGNIIYTISKEHHCIANA